MENDGYPFGNKVTAEALITYISGLNRNEKEDLYFSTIAKKHTPLRDAILFLLKNCEYMDQYSSHDGN